MATAVELAEPVTSPMSPVAAQRMEAEGRPRVLSGARGVLQTVPPCEGVGDAMLPPGYGMMGRKQGVLTKELAPGDVFQAERGAAREARGSSGGREHALFPRRALRTSTRVEEAAHRSSSSLESASSE